MSLEVSTAFGGVEPSGSGTLVSIPLRQIVARLAAMAWGYPLFAPKVLLRSLGLIVEIACVFDGDFIPDLGLVSAIALGDELPSDTHCC